jgi:hypothetical protein
MRTIKTGDEPIKTDLWSWFYWFWTRLAVQTWIARIYGLCPDSVARKVSFSSCERRGRKREIRVY